MTACCSPCYTWANPLLQFADVMDPFLSTAALFSRFYSHMIQTWAVKVASYLARWILRSHMQYAIEIGSSCNFQVSQGSVATQLRWDGWHCVLLFFLETQCSVIRGRMWPNQSYPNIGIESISQFHWKNTESIVTEISDVSPALFLKWIVVMQMHRFTDEDMVD